MQCQPPSDSPPVSRRRFLTACVLAPLARAGQNSSGMALIPGGTFWMGTSEEAIESKYAHLGPRLRAMLKSETPRHRLTIRPYYMDRCEVTNRQFLAFVEKNPQWRPDRIDRRFHNGDYLKHWTNGRVPSGAGDHPVVYVTWYAAVAFALWAGKRLPTEAEWEYAARGGLPAAEYPWGDHPPTPELANYAESRRGGVVPVGRYLPNGYGLLDMAGNVWEYCLDEWSQSYDPSPESANHRSISDWASVKTRRVIRGGSWGGAPINLRVAFRDSHPPEGAGPHVGFRCVRNA